MEETGQNLKKQAQNYGSKLKVVFSNIEKPKNGGKPPVCLLPASIFQKYHNDERLKYILDEAQEAVRKGFFSSIRIIPAGTLNAHNYKMEMKINDEEAYKKAKQAEDDWISRHRGIIDTIQVPCKLDRWDDWHNHELFQSKMDYLMGEFNKNNGFKGKVENVAQLGATRIRNDATEISLIDRIKYAQDYILEEIAVILIWNDILGKEDNMYLCYPTDSNKAAYAMQEAVNKLPIANLSSWKIKFSNISLKEENKSQKDQNKSRASTFPPDKSFSPDSDGANEVDKNSDHQKTKITRVVSDDDILHKNTINGTSTSISDSYPRNGFYGRPNDNELDPEVVSSVICALYKKPELLNNEKYTRAAAVLTVALSEQRAQKHRSRTPSPEGSDDEGNKKKTPPLSPSKKKQ